MIWMVPESKTVLKKQDGFNIKEDLICDYDW